MADKDQAMEVTSTDINQRWNDIPEDAESGNGSRGDGKRNGEDRKRLTGSLGAKITAFFLLAIASLMGFGAALLCVILAENDFYTETLNDLMLSAMNNPCMNKAYEVREYLENGDLEGAEYVCENGNIDIEVVQIEENGKPEVLWSTWDGYETMLTHTFYFELSPISKQVKLNNHLVEKGKLYQFRTYVDPDFSENDTSRRMAEITSWLYKARYKIIGIAAVGIFLSVLCFIFLMCSAGHRNGQEGIVPGVLTGIPVDLLTLVFGGPAFFLLAVGLNLRYASGYTQPVFLVSIGIVLVVWLTVYCMEISLRLKLGKCLHNSIIYLALRGFRRISRFLGKGLAAMVRGIPLVLTTLTIYLGICILEFLGMARYMHAREGFLLWGIEKIVLFAIITYIALICYKLLAASRALAEGQENYTVDTSIMIGDFKEHGENLNSVGQGIARAVAERMKSEHLKTELITNVSHDLKTPLTSIINYADLIYEETIRDFNVSNPAGETGNQTVSQSADSGFVRQNAIISEYAEVLLRQSRRLKKLLEDLLEASKATTGNLEVNLEPCEVGVLLSQAVGEYQQRMDEKGLELIARQPDTPVKILADGRHLWRVFDNLLNNICKYAQENSRVYLSVEVREGRALLIFRNMSKYPLDISSEELEERFVRGDKSRHMDGNGLGLSIARSLVDLQNGKMEITIDGDLFKVILGFAVYEP